VRWGLYSLIGRTRLIQMTGMIRSIRIASMAFLMLSIEACVGTSGPSPAPQPELDPAGLTVEVENQNFSDATIYAFNNGQRLRLGRVTGKTTETFKFRWYQNELQMVIDFTGGGLIVSEKQVVYPGVDDNLRLIIAARASRLARLRGR
jgi:hypothetical protein